MTPAAAKKDPADAATPAANAAVEAAPAAPIVVTAKKKKKRKTTKGLKDVQRIGRGLLKAGDRVADGLAAGASSLRKRSNKSSRKKRDGAIRDALENWALAGGKALRKSALAPYDVARRLNNRQLWRQTRAAVSVALAPLNLFLR